MISRFLAVLFLTAAPAWAEACIDTEFRGHSYTVCTTVAGEHDLRLFLYDDQGLPYGQFTSIETELASQGNKLGFAMNAGMYHENRDPVGHYVEDGTEVMRVIPNAGPGNFGLLPNGILCVQDHRTDVIETLRYLEEQPDCTFATQSGPMLVIDRALHPRFLRDSTSRFIRNGVGTTAEGTQAMFVISNEPVTFHEFGTFFKEGLNVPNALFLDGRVSRLYAPDIGRRDFGFSLGPIVGTVIKSD